MRSSLLLFLVASLSLLASKKAHQRRGYRIILEYGPNVGKVIPLKLQHYLDQWIDKSDRPLSPEDVLNLLLLRDGPEEGIVSSSRRRKLSSSAKNDSRPILLISVGNSASWDRLMSSDQVDGLFKGNSHSKQPESFGVVSMRRGPVALIAGNGKGIDAQWGANTWVNTGAAYAAYHILQELGFAFWNPLQPIIPPVDGLQDVPEGTKAKWEIPHWRSRAFHLHTQHPLELTDVLQGFDIPLWLDRGKDAWDGLEALAAEEEEGWVHSASTRAINTCGEGGTIPSRKGNNSEYCEIWEKMAPQVGVFFEWCLAHRLNRVEWILLGNHRWGPIVESSLRHRRLQLLVRMGQSLGLMLGIDDPIAFQQQHSWVMTTTLGSRASQLKQVRERVDWILSAGFDFLSTESGMSEFTHPNDQLMLDLLNEFAERVNGTWGKEATVKVHCSTGQTCNHFVDPRTGKPLNFNFLPTYATSKLGVLPHTVQAYALDDPSAGVYANNNFTYIMDYMLWEAGLNNRSVHFYPETAYWVNVDIDVPLFLPLYAERRMYDLRLLSREEEKRGLKLSGILNFDSGWEWGYWLNDIIMAAVSWDPWQYGRGENAKDEDNLAFFQQAVIQALRPLHLEAREKLGGWLTEFVKVQYEVLLLGQVDGQPCPDQTKLSGIAYLMGVDTWVELPRMLGLSFTQPNLILNSDHSDPMYPHVQPVLNAMSDHLGSLYEEGKSLIHELRVDGRIVATLLDHVSELQEGVGMMALRAKQVALLYEATAPDVKPAERKALIQESRSVLEEATKIVMEREKHYRAPLGRMSGWREGPTVYRFGYLWTVHSLYYFWRDQGQVEGATAQARLSPCYLNRMDPLEVAIGLGMNILQMFRGLATSKLPFANLWADCLAPPLNEFVFPRDL